MVQDLWKTVWQFLKKLKTDLPYDPAIPPLGIYPKELEAESGRSICTPMFITALFIVAKMWKLSRCSCTDECISKMWYIHTMEYYSTSKREEILT